MKAPLLALVLLGATLLVLVPNASADVGVYRCSFGHCDPWIVVPTDLATCEIGTPATLPSGPVPTYCPLLGP